MSPVILIVVPLLLVIVGMILNSLGGRFDNPETSSEQNPAKRLAAEKEAYRKLIELEREQFVKRQRRIGQYAWLLLIAFAVSLGWMYFDTVSKTTASKRIAAIQTVPTAEGKDVVLSMTLHDGSTEKYLIQSTKVENPDRALTAVSKEPLTSWELLDLKTALSTGQSPVPAAINLKIEN